MGLAAHADYLVSPAKQKSDAPVSLLSNTGGVAASERKTSG